MSKDFATLHPIDTENALMDNPTYVEGGYTPSYHRIQSYIPYATYNMEPAEFTSWQDEAIAAQKTVVISACLNPSPIYRISGPDARRFLEHVCVNNFEKFPIMSSKHGIMVNEDGDIVCNGVLMRIAEDSYEAHWMTPMKTLFEMGDYDASFEDLTMSRFIFQIVGPKSLETVEDAAEADFHELKMCRMVKSEICGHEVRVLRFGMTGGLAYEVHGDNQFAKEIHRRIIEVGNTYGIRMLGTTAYYMFHTPGGSVQFSFHYDPAMSEADRLRAKENAEGAGEFTPSMAYDYPSFKRDGSCTDPEKLRANPYEMGLGKIINYDHDFIGKEALLAYRDNQKMTGVTLKWNEEDILDVYASQLRDEEPYKRFPGPNSNMYYQDHAFMLTMDRVEDADGNVIGYTGGRTESPFHHAMLSFGKIDLTFAEQGTEVYVVWGDEGERQKRIRATVVPTPYNTNYSNWTFDVMGIPRKYA